MRNHTLEDLQERGRIEEENARLEEENMELKEEVRDFSYDLSEVREDLELAEKRVEQLEHEIEELQGEHSFQGMYQVELRRDKSPVVVVFMNHHNLGDFLGLVQPYMDRVTYSYIEKG